MNSAREETTRLADLLRREQHALAEFLVALATFDAERRWVELGHRSLFSFLVRELGLSKGAAYYRKTGAELVRSYPEVLAALRAGKLCLTSVVELAKVIAPENKAELLPRFFHISKREAKEVTAELLPSAAPPLRTVVTAPAAARFTSASVALALAPDATAVPDRHDLGRVRGEEPDLDEQTLAEIPGGAHRARLSTGQVFRPTSSVPSTPIPDGAPAPAAARRRAEVEPLTSDLRRIHLTVSRRLLEKLAAARDALSHSHPGASDDEILEVGLDLVIARYLKRRGIGVKPRKRTPTVESTASPGTATSQAAAPDASERPGSEPALPARPVPASAGRTRHVPADVWRAVWERDQGRCAWPVEGGGVCGSTRRLQLNHVDGFAVVGETSPERCRLLCDLHNDLHAREVYGDGVMNTYTRPKRGASGAAPRAAFLAEMPGSPTVAP